MLLPEFRLATKKISEADLVIVSGTSLSVYPVNELISSVNGKLVIINRDSTQADKKADLVIHQSLGKVFSQL